jgi:hypothetical protein
MRGRPQRRTRLEGRHQRIGAARPHHCGLGAGPIVPPGTKRAG